jgi:hypothetical protein
MGEAIWGWIVRRIAREWEVIQRAPFAFSLTVLLLGAVLWYGISSYYLSHYEGTLSALQATNDFLEKQLQVASGKTVASEDEVKELRKQLAQSQARQKDRRLTDQQKVQLTAWLRPYRYCRGEIESNPNPEAVDFATDFQEVLTGAGWENVGTGQRQHPPIRSGVSVQADPRYLDVVALVSLLQGWNFEARSEHRPDADSCFLKIEIGDRY